MELIKNTYNQNSGIESEKRTQENIDANPTCDESLYDDRGEKMFSAPFSIVGRIRRTEYGLSLIIECLYVFIAARIAGNPILYFILLIPFFWFCLAQGAKRCHDRNNSGWYQFIPFYGLWMLFADGDVGENDYGPDPKGRKLEK